MSRAEGRRDGQTLKGEFMLGKRRSEEVALGIRQRVFLHTLRNHGGYLSQACSAAELLSLLYNELLQLGAPTAPPIPRPFAGVPSAINPESFTGAGYHGPFAPEYDRFFVSPAHYALVIYSALIEAGRMAPEALSLFNRDGESVEMIGAEHSPGMEVTTGSLAQGLSCASGVAWSRKRRGEPGKVWVFLSDGELQEGQTWECFAAAYHLGLNNLRIIIDQNRQQCDGAMDAVLEVPDWGARLRAFGAEVAVVDGHDLNALRDAASQRPERGPLVILAETCPWQGMPALEVRAPRLHYVRFLEAGAREALASALAPVLSVGPDRLAREGGIEL